MNANNTTSHALEFTDQDFAEDVLHSDQPVLVDFGADWCPPCKALSPTIDSLAEQYAGWAKVGKLDVDKNPETATKYSIRSIPTILVFNDGEVVEQFVGLKNRKELEAALDGALASTIEAVAV